MIAAGGAGQALESSRDAIVAMSRATPLHVVATAGEAPSEGVVTAVLRDVQVVLPMAGLFDVEAERQRLNKQLAASEAEVERLQSRLADEQFVARAPEAVVQREREKLEAAKSRSEGLRRRLQELA